METNQWILIIALSLVFIMFYTINFYVSKTEAQITSGILMLIMYALTIVALIITIAEMNLYKRMSKGNCPKYELINEDVYKLKK
jgi:ABC-type uncharacterized transport system permease subunit